MMKILLAHCDFAPVSLPLLNIKGYVNSDPELASRLEMRIEGGFPHEDPEDWMNRILYIAQEMKPQVVGLSIYVWSRFRMYEVSRRLKILDPNIKIVWGGPDVSDRGYSKELMAEHAAVDIIARDEGERIFKRLVQRWLTDASDEAMPFEAMAMDEMKGITYRAEDGSVVDLDTVDFLNDLDEIPSLMDSEEIQAVKDTIDVFALETFRGCYMGCAYCYWGGSRRRAFSPERVYSDLGRILAQKNIKKVWFFDSMFGFKKNVAKELLRFIIEHKSPDQNITFFPNLDFLDEELCQLMKDAGIYIEAGIQTTNERAYEYLNRKWDKKFLDSKIPMLDKYGLKSNAQQLILGLPGDDLEGFKASVDYAFHTRPEAIQIFPFSVLPATGYWKRREEFKIKHEGEYRIVYDSTTFPEDDMVRAGIIMSGTKWFELHPGLAFQIVSLLDIQPSDLFEAIGRTFMDEVWQLKDTPETRPEVRKALLTQAFSDDDVAKLRDLEFLRKVLNASWGHTGLAPQWDELIRLAYVLNNKEVLTSGLQPAEEFAGAEAEWEAHPEAVGPITAAFNIFDSASWKEPGGFENEITFRAFPIPTPVDFFGKDVKQYKVLVSPRSQERTGTTVG